MVSPTSPPPPYMYEQQLPLNPSAPQARPYSQIQNTQIVPDNSSESSSYQRPRPTPGNRKCDSDSCVTCDLMLTGTTFKSTMTGKDYKFMPNVGCHTKIIIYLVSLNLEILVRLGGSFTNYVDKILAFFYHLPPALTFSMV